MALMQSNQRPPEERTRQSMIDGLPVGDEYQWNQFFQRYTPLIEYVGRKNGVHESEMDELDQLTTTSLHKTICVKQNFQYDPQKGRFRGYVYTAAKHAAWALTRRRRDVPLPDAETLGETIRDRVEEMEQHERLYETLQALMDEASDTGRRDIEIFRRAVLDGDETQALAREYGISTGRVHGIKSEIGKLLCWRCRRDWGEPDPGERNRS